MACPTIDSLSIADLVNELTDAQIQGIISGRLSQRVVEFTSVGSNTYTKPSDLVYAFVVCIGGGGGGGSGRRYPAGNNRAGGGGASGGSLARRFLTASQIGVTETVTVGNGGTGGAAPTTDTTNGNSGTNGGDTSFGSLVIATAGRAGGGGSTSGSAGTSGTITSETPSQYPLSVSRVAGAAGDTSTGGPGSSVGFSDRIGGGAASGAGVNSSNTQAVGGTGSRNYDRTATLSASVAGGSAGGGAGTDGLNNVSLQLHFDYVSGVPLNTIGYGTTGSGGGSNNAGGGGEGGDAGLYGAGGCGAGAGLNGTTGGRGGNGAQGCCIVFEYYV